MKITRLTPNLLQRYAAGTLTPAEQHAVERLLLSDPLAAEAVEGLTRLREDGLDPTPTHLDLRRRLQDRVQSGQRRGRVLAFPLHFARYAAAAVTVLLVAGLGWWVLRDTPPMPTVSETAVAPSPSAPALPQTSPAPAVPAEEVPALAKAESRKTTAPTQPAADAEETAVLAEPSSLPLAASPPLAQIPRPDSGLDEIRPDEVAVQGYGAAAKRALSAPAAKPAGSAPPAVAPAPAPITGPRYVGRVVGVEGEPVPGASVFLTQSKKGTTTDALGRFVLPDFQPAAARLRIAAIGYKVREIAVRDTAVGTIALKPEASALSEVVVVGSGQTPDYSPEGGFDSLKSFIEKTRRVAGKGTVLLSFQLSKDGRPERIRVQKSTNPALNAEAIRLLAAGPRWRKNAATRRGGRVGYAVVLE